MQAWELERELAKAQDKLEAVKDVIEKIYNEVTPIYGFIPNKGTQEIKKILEDSRSCSESADKVEK